MRPAQRESLRFERTQARWPYAPHGRLEEYWYQVGKAALDSACAFETADARRNRTTRRELHAACAKARYRRDLALRYEEENAPA